MLAGARGSFLLQKRTEKTEKLQKLLAGARLLASYAAILIGLPGARLCFFSTLTLTILFIGAEGIKKRKKKSLDRDFFFL